MRGRVLGLVLTLAACGAGQRAQTSAQTTMTGGVGGRVGSLVVRDAQITNDGPITGDAVYPPGRHPRAVPGRASLS